MKLRVFVYGTLKRGFWNNHAFLGTAAFLGEAVSVADCFHMYDGGFPYVTNNGISRIKGELYEFEDERILAGLDRLEGVPTHYVRVEKEFILLEPEPSIPGLEAQVTASVYIASPTTERYLSSTRERISPDDNNIVEWRRA